MRMMLLLLLLGCFGLRSDFKMEQLKNERVKKAYADNQPSLNSLLKNKNLEWNALEIYLQAYKQERVLEVWARNKTDKQFRLLRTFPFCTSSGTLGPKNKQGDKQIPEGFYTINRFHPESLYFLSLGLNYPNAADQQRSQADNLGGDIFIHGKCASLGCIPITDEGIKTLYVLAVEARHSGQTEIPVHIFPARLTAYHLEKLSDQFEERPDLISFWQNLKAGYDHFQQHKTVPVVEVNNAGKYVFR